MRVLIAIADPNLELRGKFVSPLAPAADTERETAQITQAVAATRDCPQHRLPAGLSNSRNENQLLSFCFKRQQKKSKVQTGSE